MNPKLVALLQANNTCLGMAMLLPDSDIVHEMRYILVRQGELCVSIIEDNKDWDEEAVEDFFEELDAYERQINVLNRR